MEAPQDSPRDNDRACSHACLAHLDTVDVSSKLPMVHKYSIVVMLRLCREALYLRLER